MRKFYCQIWISLVFLVFSCASLKAQTSAPGVHGPWLASQLIEPAELAAAINAGKFVIFNIGAVGDIKGAKHIGPASKAENLEKFKAALQKLPKSASIVIYCGCCPFTKCPNVGPAFLIAQKLGFVHVKILDLPVNLKTNWTDKGYPLAGEPTAN